VTTERREPAGAADERAMLEGWLDYHRATLEWKCDGLSDEQLRERSVSPSALSLLGLVRHMVEVERAWFRIRFKGEEVQPTYFTNERPNDDFDDLESSPPSDVFDEWRAECERSRSIAAAAALDDLSVGSRAKTGEQVSMRWIMTHMIEEYARHNGHADLLRERIDGATGD
jgi:uncharacterized damage-inducible protein DinB